MISRETIAKMDFYVIYSVDANEYGRIDIHRPPHFQKLEWRIAASGPSEFYSSRRSKSRHRQYTNVLNFKQLCEFIDGCDLYPDDQETMGSLTELGWLPAMSFSFTDYDVFGSAYISPLPPQPDYNRQPLLPGMPEDLDAYEWKNVEDAVADVFKSGDYANIAIDEAVGC